MVKKKKSCDSRFTFPFPKPRSPWRQASLTPFTPKSKGGKSVKLNSFKRNDMFTTFSQQILNDRLLLVIIDEQKSNLNSGFKL